MFVWSVFYGTVLLPHHSLLHAGLYCYRRPRCNAGLFKRKKLRKLKNIILFKTICGQGALWRAEQEKGGTKNRQNGGRILSTVKNVYNMVKPK